MGDEVVESGTPTATPQKSKKQESNKLKKQNSLFGWISKKTSKDEPGGSVSTGGGSVTELRSRLTQGWKSMDLGYLGGRNKEAAVCEEEKDEVVLEETEVENSIVKLSIHDEKDTENMDF